MSTMYTHDIPAVCDRLITQDDVLGKNRPTDPLVHQPYICTMDQWSWYLWVSTSGLTCRCTTKLGQQQLHFAALVQDCALHLDTYGAGFEDRACKAQLKTRQANRSFCPISPSTPSQYMAHQLDDIRAASELATSTIPSTYGTDTTLLSACNGMRDQPISYRAAGPC